MRHFLPSPRRLSSVLAAGAVGVVAAAAFGAPALACHSVIQVSQPKCSTSNAGSVEIKWTLNSVPAGAVLSEIKINAGTMTGDIKDKAVLKANGLVAVQTLPLSAGYAQLDGLLTWTSVTGNSKKPKYETHTWKLSQSGNKIKFDDLKCDGPERPPVKASEIAFTPDCESVVVTVKNPSDEARKYLIDEVEGQITVAAGEEKSVTVTGSKVTDGAITVYELTDQKKKVVGKKEWTPSPCESVTPSGSIIPSAVASSSAAASLPVTGTNVALISGAAVLLVGAGVGMFLVARRRRVRFTA